jgi:energy-coupling factor transporter ATP-binding protein EcfA2
MIINIRGTSGSGKSTLVREIMDLYPTKTRVMVKDRKQPLAYLLSTDISDDKPLYVAGHYETACGGCDTITSYDDNYSYILKAHEAGYHVLFEGLLISAETRRMIELKDKVGTENVLVIALEVDLETCLESINTRRRVKKPDAPPVNPKNTESKYKGVKSCMKKLAENGVRTMWLDRWGGYVVTKKELGL